MVVYSVTWSIDTGLSRGKGRPSSKERLIGFSVMCRSASDAVSCLHWVFSHDLQFKDSKYTVDDGIIELRRMTVDSRGFNVNYLFMDGIRQPLSLSNVKESLERITYLNVR